MSKIADLIKGVQEKEVAVLDAQEALDSARDKHQEEMQEVLDFLGWDKDADYKMNKKLVRINGEVKSVTATEDDDGRWWLRIRDVKVY